jgi:hypothetical protein
MQSISSVNVNDAQYHIFRLVGATESMLAPNQDSQVKHTYRANYQAAVHTRCFWLKPVSTSYHTNHC